MPQRLYHGKKKKWENDHAINEQIIGCRLWIKERKKENHANQNNTKFQKKI